MNNILYDRMNKICKRVSNSILDVYRDGSALKLCKLQMLDIMEKMGELQKPAVLDAVEAAETDED